MKVSEGYRGRYGRVAERETDVASGNENEVMSPDSGRLTARDAAAAIFRSVSRPAETTRPNRDQSSLRPGRGRCGITILSAAGPSAPSRIVVQSDPRSSTLTQDAAASGPSVFRRSNRGQKQFGRIGREVTFFAQQMPGDRAQAPRDDGDGGIGFLAAGAVPPIDAAEVRRATDGHPGGFDKGPFQPASKNTNCSFQFLINFKALTFVLAEQFLK